MTKRKLHFVWFVYIGCFLLAFTAIGICNNERSLYLQPASAALGVSRMTISLAFFVGQIINFIINFNYGRLNRRFGLRRIVLFGIIMMVTGNLLFSFSTVYIGYFFGEVCLGIGFGCATMTSISLFVNNWFGNYHGTLLGIIYMATGLGTVCFNPTIGSLIANHGYRSGYMFHMGAMAVMAVIGFIVFFAKPQDKGCEKLFFGNKDAGKKEVAIEGLTAAEARKKPVFYVLTAMTFLMGFGIMAVQGTYGAFIGADMSRGTLFAATITSVIFAFNCIFKIPVGIMADKLGVVSSVVFCSTTMGLAGLSLALMSPTSSLLPYLFAFCMGTGNIMMTVAYPLLAPRMFGTRDVAALTGIVMGCANLGAAFGNLLTNTFYTMIGTYKPVYIFVFVVFIAGIITTILVVKPVYSKE